jgi:hypothetical protein
MRHFGFSEINERGMEWFPNGRTLKGRYVEFVGLKPGLTGVNVPGI